MNIKQIKECATNGIIFERGVDYYENGHVKNYHLHISDIISLKAEVIGSLNSIYHVSADIDQNGKLIDYNCQCPAFNTYKGCCKHVIALLLNFYYDKDQKAKKFVNTNSKTDVLAFEMITKYTNKSINDVILKSNHQKVHLIPKLDLNHNGKLFMSFTIGHTKQYALRSISQFYYDMRYNNITEYGKNLTFYHHLNNFSNESQELVKFLLNTYYENEYLEAKSNIYTYSYYNDNRYLIISPRSFDRFYEIYLNRDIMFSYDNITKKITLLDKAPELVLTITTNDKENFSVSLNLTKTLMIRGENYQYLLIDNELYRLANEYLEKIQFLLDALVEEGSPLNISRHDMPSFYVNVLENVKDVLKIDADETILLEFAPTPLVAKLYIDLENSTTIIAKLIFLYDDIEVNAFDDSKINIYRNIKEELIIKSMVKKYFTDEIKSKSVYMLTDNDLILRLYTEGFEELTNYMQIYISDRCKSLIRQSPNIKIGVSISNNLLDINIEPGDISLKELQDILSAYRKQKKYYRLKDGSFLILNNNSVDEFFQVVEGIDVDFNELENNHIFMPKSRSLYVDNILKNSKYINSERDNTFKEIVRDFKNIDDTSFIIPDSLNDILRNYQKTGYRWLRTLNHYGFGGILADDMGLGKTIQIISLIQSYVNEENNPLPSLIVCPASLVLNWEMEFQQFAPNISVISIIGQHTTRQKLIENINSYQVALTSYDYLKRDIDHYRDYNFMYHVIDEAQYIKNHLTQNAKSNKLIKSNNRFALTGTPIENNLAEIWSIFDFIMPGYLYSYNKFNKDYEIPIVKEANEQILENLQRLVKPFVLRRIKKDVLKELPDKIETTMYANLEGEQYKLYLANLALIKKEIGDKLLTEDMNKNRIMILSMLTRLRQICCHPGLYYEDYHGESAKLDLCLELIDNCIASGHKILLFSQFTSMLAIIKDKLKDRNISFYLLEGSTKKEERLQLVDRFNKDDTNVFLISLKAGGTGINLTSADVVIHYDPWWNLSVQNQATDRAHRIGQDKKVQVYKLITKNTIEEKILKLQEAKSKLADSLIVKDDGIITKMSNEEILALFD